jgi:hypothetical protein
MGFAAACATCGDNAIVTIIGASAISPSLRFCRNDGGIFSLDISLSFLKILCKDIVKTNYLSFFATIMPIKKSLFFNLLLLLILKIILFCGIYPTFLFQLRDMPQFDR